jgi:hypothetical protein
MARVTVTEAGYYAGRFLHAGDSYDDGTPANEASAETKAKPAKKAGKSKSGDRDLP